MDSMAENSSPLAPQHDRDLLLVFKVVELEQGQQRVEEALGNVVALLQKLLAHLTAKQEAPLPPIADPAQLYASLDEEPSGAREDVSASDEALPSPPGPHSWRRLFAARSTRVLAVVAVIVVGSLPWTCLNLTGSAPRGLWLKSRVPAVVERGMWVILPAPASVKPWVRGWWPLLKPVAAVAGERVCIMKETLWIRGQSYGRVFAVANGRELPSLREGCATVSAGEVFLASAVRASMDSRYFGAVPVSALTAQATPLLTLR
jgi:type IV secretory pathway protease TraF